MKKFDIYVRLTCIYIYTRQITKIEEHTNHYMWMRQMNINTVGTKECINLFSFFCTTKKTGAVFPKSEKKE